MWPGKIKVGEWQSLECYSADPHSLQQCIAMSCSMLPRRLRVKISTTGWREGGHIVGKTLDLKQRKKHAANICTKEEVGKGKPLENDNRPVHSDLKNCETGLAKVVKSSPRFFILEASAKDLHSEQRENEYKEDEQDQQGIDRGDGVDQTLDQITHRGPVSGIKELRGSRKGEREGWS